MFAAFHGDLRAIGRKHEPECLVLLEVGKLAVRRAIKRLQPQVVHAFLPHKVYDPFAIRRVG